MVFDSQVTVLSIMLALGGVANLMLALCLAHTWRYWRQVKWYMVMLTVGNWLEVMFRFAMELGWVVTGYWKGTDGSCKFLMMMDILGPSLAAMSLAALSLHVLLTNITGNQGNRLRHVLVIGLFLVLSLPLPLSMIPVFRTKSYSTYEDNLCVPDLGQRVEEQYLQTGVSVGLTYFPLLVFLGCGLAALLLFLTANRGSIKDDENGSDLVIMGLLGLVMLVCCVPYHTYRLVHVYSPQKLHAPGDTMSSYRTMFGLLYLEYTRNVLSAVASVVFAYVHAFRNRKVGYISPEADMSAGGERQKLVN